ncbi:S9 family peptidase [Fulvivirga lutimaris]|uniref:S9 family peptidase n=1 Tax=Fulvivirga lutimaris TaxID=1819566 RepID=UPI0012BB630F|nr:alpha/beta fold hydrolase [Fulvivirga lutimaris]MTI38371.1 S9 family peptidase [Fulvivirga lutimaris]
MKLSTSIALLFLSLQTFGQVKNDSQLSLSEIMKGEDFIGHLPSSISWSDNSQNIYFNWNPDGDTLSSTYAVSIGSKDIHKLSIDEQKAMTERGNYSKGRAFKVYDKNGDIFLMDNSTYSITQITNTIARESDPVFAGNDEYIVYKNDNNLFSWQIKTGTVEQLTNFKSGKERKNKPSEQDKWLKKDELEYFDILQKRKNESDARSNRRDKTSPKRPKEIYTGDMLISNMSMSPDMRYVVYELMKAGDRKGTIVPDFVTESGYTEDLNARPKVGSPLPSFESWIFDLKQDSAYQIKTDNIEGIYDKPAYLKEYAKNLADYKDKYEKPREVNIGNPVFSDDSKAVVNITSNDYKDRWIMSLDLSSGDLKLIDRQHDDAWIGGPEIGWFSPGVIEWLDNDNIWFKSEATGYAHLYTANVNTGKVKALTKGDFEILDVELSNDKQTFFITSNKESPHLHHFYHLPVKGGKMTQITSQKGGHEVTVSPDEKYLAVRYSYINKPWELYLMKNEAGAKMEQLTTSTTDAFKNYNWRDTKIVNFKASDGVSVPATLYEPTEGKKNGAAVIFVHGAGYLQNVHNWWSSYYREYMFNNMLADNGYTVLAIDFRASRGYGRDWRTAIYRHMGGRDMDDQVDGAKYLVEQQGIDPERIGIYGGSYGGFITLMGMFKYPDTFKSGAALRSVTDWAHYNHGYTANILNTPVQDSLAYARSSPIYYAEGLKGNLLILHGMVDTNVHFQDVVRLSQRLIELGKTKWDMAVFPMEGHGFVESSSWADEYRRIFELFQNTLQKE